MDRDVLALLQLLDVTNAATQDGREVLLGPSGLVPDLADAPPDMGDEDIGVGSGHASNVPICRAAEHALLSSGLTGGARTSRYTEPLGKEPAVTQTARVLVLDDDRPLRSGMACVLSSYDVTTVGTIAEARTRLLAERFDAVVSDVDLPDGSGVALFEEIAELRPAWARSYVFLTGVARAPAQAKAASLGIPWLTKPVFARKLLDTVAAIVAGAALPPVPRDA